MDNLTPAQRHKNMSHIQSKNTKTEILFRKLLWKHGIRYRVNYPQLPGKPDIVITRCHIAIFIDGDFWHGRDMTKLYKQIKSNRGYWLPKIQKNKARDAEINDQLSEMGWLIYRFWESDVKHNPEKFLKIILDSVPYAKKDLP